MPTAATAVASATVPLPEVARHDYRVLATIGRGHVGTVFLVTPRCHLRHRQQPVVVPPLPFFFAMKVSKKTTKKKSAEKEILSLIKEHEHSFLPSLRGAFESQKREFLIMDYCPGGDLHSLRLGQPDSRFSSAAILFYGAEVLAALEYLHSLGIVYRDLKPENILLKESGHVVLTDFDLSLQLQQPEQLITSNNGPRQDPPATEKHNKTRFWPKWKVFSSFHRCIPIKSNNDGDGDSDTRNPNPNPISYPNRNPNPNPYYNPKPNPNANPNSNQNYNPSPNPNPNPNAYSNPSPNSNPNPNPNPNPSPNSNSNPNPNASPNPDPNSREGKKHEEVKAMATSGNEYSFVGTEEYMAPEILRGDKQGYTVDWWAFGILLYELAYGVTPFRGHSRDETFHNIMKKEPYLPGSPSLLKDLIQRLLVKDPGGRLGSEGGATALKRHSFFRDVRWDELEFVCRPPFLPPPFSLQELKDRTQQRRRIPVVAHHSTPQIQKSWSASLSSSSSSSFSSSSSSSSASFSSSSTSFSLSQSP